jgi:tetratricopeptide (TPR) repeat protein
VSGAGAGRRISARLLLWGVLLGAAIVIAKVRPQAVAAVRTTKLTSDVLTLPPPSILVEASLGYRAALADLLYTNTVITYSKHTEERHRWEYVGQYLDSIVALDPAFCQPYRYADTFIIYQPSGNPSPDDVRHARRLLEKGLEMCPTDGRLWLSAGQFMVFIGTQFLTDDAEKAAFRAAGAKMLARAAELVSDNQNVQWQALAAAGVFTREGNREAAISFLERAYYVADDEELKSSIAKRLASLRQEGAIDEARRRNDVFNELWRRDLPFVSRSGVLVLGPPYDAALCAGEGRRSASCAETWAAWAKAFGDRPVANTP